MIISVETSRPCRLYDAEGRQVMYALWADTETGEVIQYARKDGQFVVQGKEVVRETRYHPAPLRVEPMKGVRSR